MMRISLLKTVKHALSAFLLLLLPYCSFAQSDVGFSILSNQNGDFVTSDVMVYNFDDIMSMQFTLTWDPTQLEFISVDGFNLANLGNPSFGTNFINEGNLTFAWFDPQTQGITVPDCTPIFRINFQSIGASLPPIEIADDPTVFEIINGDFEALGFLLTPLCGGAGTVSGNVFYDLNNDCLFDLGETEMAGWVIQFDGDNNTSYATTKADGSYEKLLLPGTYDVSVVLPENDLWTACTPTQTIALDSAGAETAEFPVQAFLNCPSLNVDFSAPFLRRCFESNYYVQYCNSGTDTAEDAYIEIEFDPYLEVITSSIPWTTVNANTYTFPIGDASVGDCGSFYVTVKVNCDAVLGQTHCSEAHIFPDDPCTPTSPLWDGSDLEITGTCDGDSVRFEIKNLGDDMAQPLEFIVIEDDMIYLQSAPIQLLSQETATVAVEANGSTWRVEMPQTAFNPHGTFTTDAVEGCGTNGSGSFSLGFVTQFPQAEESPFIDEDCQENIGAFDPNDKIGYPKGFCAAHYIREGQDIEYKIRFQNTGTDTAFNIVIRDTLSLNLDPVSVRPGAASHPYAFELMDDGVLVFNFANIMLPDSNVNEQASHGFVKFTISQKPNLAMGTVIENEAAIYFDFNEPVITNTYHHTLGDDFVEMGGQSGDLSVSGYVKTWYGEPVEDVAMSMTNLCPVFTDNYGYFLFENIDTAFYTLSASKVNDNPGEGVTVLDLVKIRRHILFLDQLNFYQQIAADQNGSFGVTTYDIVLLSKIILGVPSNFGFTDWHFIDADYIPNPPFIGIPSVIDYNPLDMSLDGQDFIAIKPGNVITESMVETSSINTEFFFEAEQINQSTLRVEVKANDFTSVNAFQYGLKWDPSIINLQNIEAGAVTNPPSAWTSSPIPGQLTIALIINDATGITVSSNETLFTLVFNVTGPINSTTLIELDESNIPFQVVVEECKLASGNVTSTEVTIEDPNAVVNFDDLGLQIKLAPNPLQMGEPFSLQVETSNAMDLGVQLYDVNGSLLHAQAFNSPAGNSSFLLKSIDKKGIYFVKITAGGAEKTVKLMVY